MVSTVRYAEEVMAQHRWFLKLVEEQDLSPVLWKPPQSRTMASADFSRLGTAELVAACTLLACRGTGPQAWTFGYRQDPVAFLLDTIEEAVSLWTTEGARLYRNRAAESLNSGWRGYVALERLRQDHRDLERRCISFSLGHTGYVSEIVHEARAAVKSADTGAGHAA
jgi:hypothetical protein